MKRPTVKKHALIAVITASVLAASCTLPALAANASAETDSTSVEADSKGYVRGYLFNER